MKHWMIVLAAVSALAFSGCNKQESSTTEVTTEDTAAPAESAETTPDATPAAEETAPVAEVTPAEPAATPTDAAPAPATPAAETPADAASDAAAAPAPGGEVTLPGGTKYTDVVLGTGAEAVAGKTVVVHYTGTLENGNQFDSSRGGQPFEFNLGAGQVIKGWDNGVAGMKVGGQRKLTIPSVEGYGETGTPGGPIPPNATLLFDVELLGVK